MDCDTTTIGAAVGVPFADAQALDDLAHELRGPLHGLLAMIELVLRDALAPPQRERVQLARHAGEHLLALVDHVFGTSLHAPPAREPVHLRELLDDVAAWHVPLAASRGLQLAVRIAPDVPPSVESDARRIRQLVVNLLQNAVRCTVAGAVEARVVRLDAAVAIEVADTGPGLPDAEIKRLCGGRSRAEPHRQIRHRGLDIVARLVAEIGAKVEVLARPGVGTCVRVTLPTDAVAPASVPRRDRLRVLVVDSRTERRRRQLVLLAAAGVEPYGAAGALEALRLATLEAIDVVLVAEGAGEIAATLLAHALRANRRWDGPVWPVARPITASELLARVQCERGEVRRETG